MGLAKGQRTEADIRLDRRREAIVGGGIVTGSLVQRKSLSPRRRVVAAQDTAEVNFSGRGPAPQGSGPGGDGKTPGFFTHATIAADAGDEAVIGPVSARIWTREAEKTA